MTVKTMPCRVCSVGVMQVETSARSATWALCKIHLAVVVQTPRERLLIQEIGDEIRRERLILSVDAEGAGWLTSKPPQPAKPHPVSYDDPRPGESTGRPRYLEVGSPHGQTVYPDVDLLSGGSGPAIDRYRTQADDADEGYKDPGYTVVKE